MDLLHSPSIVIECEIPLIWRGSKSEEVLNGQYSTEANRELRMHLSYRNAVNNKLQREDLEHLSKRVYAYKRLRSQI